MSGFSQKDKEKTENLNVGEALFWKHHSSKNKLLLTAWQDKRLCFYVSTYFNNEVTLDNESLRAARRREKHSRYRSASSQVRTKDSKLRGALKELLSDQNSNLSSRNSPQGKKDMKQQQKGCQS